jgi:hypothetical protein
MQTLVAPRAERQPARPPTASRGPADRLLHLAHEVERLVTVGHLDLELIFLAEADLTHRMRELARDLEPAGCGR